MSTLIYVPNAPRDVTLIDFSDLTTSAILGYPISDGENMPAGQYIEFTDTLDDFTQTRIQTRALATDIQQTILDRVEQALTANATWLNRTTTPTNAQVVAQVDRLTRECNGLIRLVLRQFDSASGS